MSALTGRRVKGESEERGDCHSASNSETAWHLLTGFLMKDRFFVLTWHCLVICSIDLPEKRSELHFSNNQLLKEKIGRMHLFEHKPSSWTKTKRIPQNWYGFYRGLHAALLLQAPLYLFKFDSLQSKYVCLSETEIKVMVLKQQSSFWLSFRQSQKDEHICECWWWETIQNEITENNLAGLAQACHRWPEENCCSFSWKYLCRDLLQQPEWFKNKKLWMTSLIYHIWLCTWAIRDALLCQEML